MVAYNEDEKDQEGKTICTEREREREREREEVREKKCISYVMTVENVKDHRKTSTKLSFLFISLFSIDCNSIDSFAHKRTVLTQATKVHHMKSIIMFS